MELVDGRSGEHVLKVEGALDGAAANRHSKLHHPSIVQEETRGKKVNELKHKM